MIHDEFELVEQKEERENRNKLEFQLFAIALRDGKKAPLVFGEVDPDLFIVPELTSAYVKARDFWKKQGSVSPNAIRFILDPEEQSVLDIANDAYFPSLSGQTDNMLQVYQDMVTTIKAREIADRLGSASSVDEVTDCLAALQNVLKGVGTSKPLTFKEAVANFAYEMTQPIHYIETGYPSLDSCTLIDKGDFVLLYGEQSAGKTAFSMSLALNFAKQGYKIVYYSFETTKTQMFYRATSIYAGVSFGNQLRHDLTEQDMTRFGNHQDALAALNITVMEGSDWTVERIKADALRQNADVIFIDYVGLIKSRGRTVYDKSTEVSLALHSMAQSTRIAIVALAQNNREANKSGGVGMHTISGSGQFESDADLMIGLERVGDREDKAKWPVKVRILKNKKGRVTSEYMMFEGDTQTFREMLPEERITYADVINPNENKSKKREKPQW